MTHDRPCHLQAIIIPTTPETHRVSTYHRMNWTVRKPGKPTHIAPKAHQKNRREYLTFVGGEGISALLNIFQKPLRLLSSLERQRENP